MSTVTIWHNPSCGSSRNALEHLKEKGIEPEVYLYLKAKPGRAEIEALLQKLKVRPSDLLRPKEPLGEELGLYAGASEETILAAMVEHARLIQRPVVVTAKGAVIARPKNRIDEVL